MFVYVLVLVTFGQLLLSWKNLPGADFVAAYNPIIWAIICAVVGASYAIVLGKANHRWTFALVQLLLIAVIVNIISLALYLTLRPTENVRITLLANLCFFFLPSVVLLPFGYILIRLFNR